MLRAGVSHSGRPAFLPLPNPEGQSSVNYVLAGHYKIAVKYNRAAQSHHPSLCVQGFYDEHGGRKFLEELLR
jgi:hypothetical protein